jgi:preprotein translocase subunit SecD
VYLHAKPDITMADIASARAVASPITKGIWDIEFTLTKDGAKKLENVTQNHMNKPLALLVNGKVIAAPRVRGVVGEKAVFEGNLSKDEAEKIAGAIKVKK